VGNTVRDFQQLIYQIRRRAEERRLRLEREEIRTLAEQELQELYPTEEPVQLTFHADDVGFYAKDLHIIGMLKEKVRQYGLTRERGIVSALEALKITPYRIHLRRPDGKYIKEPDGQVAKPITTWRGSVVSVADMVHPPVETEEFEVYLSPLCRVLSAEVLNTLLKECNRLLGLRKEYGLFEWKQLKLTEK